MSSTLLMLGGRHSTAHIVANALRNRFGNFPIILEGDVSGLQLARSRAKKLGYIETAGQVLFIQTVARWLKWSNRARIAEILRDGHLDATPVTSNVLQAKSINEPRVIDILRDTQPKVVAICGTRIISRQALESISGRFINMHAGITPGFRGCHGAYWALATGHPELAGTTIHWVDQGIDTGKVIKQGRIKIGPKDNFITYSYLQLAAGLPLLLQAVEEALRGEPRIEPLEGYDTVGSHLYYHPPLWSYLANRLRGVK